MAEQEISYDAILRTEIAIEILNQARAIVTARVYELEGTDPEAAEALRLRRRDLIAIQHNVAVADRQTVENLIALRGARVKCEARFWAEFRSWRRIRHPALSRWTETRAFSATTFCPTICRMVSAGQGSPALTCSAASRAPAKPWC
ncbi:hypothetical protein [Rhizobium sp. PDO1-076]|uniref:hypothetical protein n=1 Tax=Rhizobium sp. PDO1-076 TaxID=1125979 RepID=UPI001FCAED22|nr:hypothetical protein [Rhizobium sp. PDO1-076]